MTWRDLSTGQLLIAFLHADDLEGVAGELGRRRDRRVAPQLATIIRMVGMRRWNRPFRIDQTDVGVYAAQILGEIGEYRLLIRLLHERGQLRPQTILRGLHGAPPTVYAHLLPMLPKGYPINRHATIVAGGVRYAPALDGLIPLLRSKRSDTAYEAAKALGLIGDPRAVDALIGRLSLERRAWVYYQVIEALGKLGDRRATQHVVLALDVAHDSRVIYVVRALKRLGDEMAVAPLIATMHRLSTCTSSPRTLCWRWHTSAATGHTRG